MNYLQLNSFKKGNDFIKFQEGKFEVVFLLRKIIKALTGIQKRV